MFLTIKDLSAWLQIKPSTLYAWVSQGKIPFRRIYGLIRFDREAIERWLHSFPEQVSAPLPCPAEKQSSESLDSIIARVKREAYTSRHGETRPKSSLIGKEEKDGAV